MGAGKTTIGKVLAQKLSLEFFDLDWYIEDRFRMKIPQIFAEKGEEGFREIERKMLHEVAEFENVVISCGGGTPCFFDNMEYMNRQAKTIYLKAAPEVLMRTFYSPCINVLFVPAFIWPWRSFWPCFFSFRCCLSRPAAL